MILSVNKDVNYLYKSSIQRWLTEISREFINIIYRKKWKKGYLSFDIWNLLALDADAEFVVGFELVMHPERD